MASETKFDLRSTSQSFKRAAAHKAKWAHGIHSEAHGRDADHPRPARISDRLPPSHERHRISGSALKAASAKRYDMHAARAEYPSISRKLPRLNADDSASSADEDYDVPIFEDGDVHGATVNRAPVNGSQVLSTALAKAVEAFEDKETLQLVRNEWSVLDDDGEEMGLSPARKIRGKKDRSLMIEDGYEIV